MHCKAFQGQKGNALLLISYETLQRNIDLMKKSKYGLLICDEAHRLKNPTTIQFQTMYDLKTASACRGAQTVTIGCAPNPANLSV